MEKSKIGILGSGVVGKTLGAGFKKHGHKVMVGTRSPDKLEQWQAEDGKEVKAGTFEEAAAFGDILVLAVKGKAADNVLDLAGRKNLKGKIIIDTTNPIADEDPENGVLRYFTKQNESLMERLQNKVPAARFVKAFNSIGAPFMVNPEFQGGPPTMFICGNDQDAKSEVATILLNFGFEVEDMGAVEAARPIESLCVLWCIPGFRNDQWTHAFKLLKP